MQALIDGAKSSFLNAGIGHGYSHLELIKKVEEITGAKVNIKILPKREGDAGALFASNEKIKKELNWEPKYDLTKIVETAYLWHKSHLRGYSA